MQVTGTQFQTANIMNTKIIFLGMACFAATMVMVAGDCTPAKGLENFNYEDISGKWYKRKASAFVIDLYQHFIFDFKISGDEVTTSGSVQDPRAGGETKDFTGQWKIPEDHSSTFKPGFSKTLEMFNGTYTVIDIDPKCYFFLQGCPEGAPDKEVLCMFYRDEKPTDECCKEADAAVDNSGYSRSLMVDDPTYQ